MSRPRRESIIVRKVCELIASELELEHDIPENEIARLRETGYGELSAIDDFEQLRDFLDDYLHIHE